MKNYNSSGDIVKVIADADHESGDFVKISNVYGFAVDTVQTGGWLVLKTEGVFEVEIGGGATFGSEVFWDSVNAAFTSTTGVGQLVGKCFGPGLLKLT